MTDDRSIGRIVSVTGSKAIVLLDHSNDSSRNGVRPEMGTLLAIEQSSTVVIAIVCALSVPVPAQRDGDHEIRIAELGLVGELARRDDNSFIGFNRGVTTYPTLGDRVRVATKLELEYAFTLDSGQTARVGHIRQDATIPAIVKIDDLLGKHFAILGTTGTGKSCTTALILRAILEKNPAAHIVLLDPHNEYATSFGDASEVVSPRNMQLPFWMLTFEELLEVLVGNPEGRKAEIEILQELIPIAKSRYSEGRSKTNSIGMRRNNSDSGRFTVDTPVPYRISDLTGLIDERMGKLENKRDLTPFRQLKGRIDTFSQDARYAFMFGQLAVYDNMTQILGRLFRIPVNGKPITIVELTGLPTEVTNVVVSVLCRLTFDFALWSEGAVPVTLVCEEAHRYVPANPNLGFEPCKRAIARIAKEGRKYGASLCIVTQRPAEIDSTILSQCNTVFALRMSNDRDQQIVSSAVSDTGSGLLEFLPALGQREAIAFGDGVPLPVRIRFDELPKHYLPRSSTARFSERWQRSEKDEMYVDQVVERWRLGGAGGSELAAQAAMLAEAIDIGERHHERAPTPSSQRPADTEAALPAAHDAMRTNRLRQPGDEPQMPVNRLARPATPLPAASYPVAPAAARPTPYAQQPAAPAPGGPSEGNRSLRERLLQRQPTPR